MQNLFVDRSMDRHWD